MNCSRKGAVFVGELTKFFPSREASRPTLSLSIEVFEEVRDPFVDLVLFRCFEQFVAFDRRFANQEEAVGLRARSVVDHEHVATQLRRRYVID